MTIYITDKDHPASTLKYGLYTIVDTEFTSWQGSLSRNWSLPTEYREIVNIGLLRVSFEPTQIRVERGLDLYIKPVFSPILSNYFISLTGITQASLEDSPDFKHAWTTAANFIGDSKPISNGNDGQIIRENMYLHGLVYDSFYTVNIRSILMHGLEISDKDCISAELSAYLPDSYCPSQSTNLRGHTGLSDCYSLASALSFIHSKNALASTDATI